LSLQVPEGRHYQDFNYCLARELNAGAMVAAGRLAANGQYNEEKYQSKTIYVFTIDRQMRLFGCGT